MYDFYVNTPRSDSVEQRASAKTIMGLSRATGEFLGAYNNRHVQEYNQKMYRAHKAKNPYVIL